MEPSSILKIMQALLSIIKDKPKVVLSLVQLPKKPQNFGQKSHPTPDQSSENDFDVI